MASSTAVSIVDTTAANPEQTTTPRKRRRRTAATGATEDCFTCRKRSTKCDRRRPYCSQCLEIGKDCSGYRTTLTWGVGVASRGKLRGLSLPILNSTAKAPARIQQRPPPLRRVHTTAPSSYNESIFSAPSTGSVSTFSESDFPSPNEFPSTPKEIQVAEPLINSYSDVFSCQQECARPTESFSYLDTPDSYSTTSHSFATSSLGSDMNNTMCTGPFPLHSAGPTTFSDLLLPNDFMPVEDVIHSFQHGIKSDSDYLPDGLTNSSSKPLQNAIAALASNNIRMRGLQEVSGAAMDPFDHLNAEDIRDMHSDATPEELHYKATSVSLFNASLIDPNCAEDDILATLLVLCLFHVCDSGFSKFKTQLSGVQKLLNRRDHRMGTSSFVAWIQMFFTWFDVMTATVNDRETQFRGEALDSLDLSANLGALEHLAGCDGRLFKLIARLGRCSQMDPGRLVQDTMMPPSHPLTPRPSPGGLPIKDFYSLDGNGWGTPFVTSPSRQAGRSSTNPRHEFWTEWHHVRSRLSAWVVDPPFHNAPSDADTASIHNISECFRYAALLYTERLVSPDLPSSTSSIQGFVSAALRHIAVIPVNSRVNKFLLWPVFVIATECVHQNDRDIMRARCMEITRESGFLCNMSCLEILERVWAEEDAGDSWHFVKAGVSVGLAPLLSALGGQAFKWRRAMSRAHCEYVAA
ncbi:hypothetical protein EJ08DRAFT_644089 [Tothia fuscella]|uniref:Zn(2)-C6 fungal-type domain-containing protein n=1 Tax=Tothia fuscella TaxID=1048955 RepID=A0A9P4NE39_9PEZI|nr:hypothetical protein EJ08DRAFT_644089 [Tothia fuscella]